MRKLLLLATFFFIISCQENEKTQTIKIKNQYSLDLPESLSLATNLNTEASLQYQNIFNDLYVIVIDESKQEINSYMKENTDFPPNLNGYTQLLKSGLQTSVTNPKFSKTEKKQLNGSKSHQISLSGKVDDYKIYYEFAHIEGKNHYYQVFVWTSLEKKEKLSTKMKKIINSFKELKSRGR